MSLNGLSVLLAEDNPTNQMVATQMLESLGAEVTLAEDGAQALEILKARDFDVALIDIEMPRVTGIDVIRTVRASRTEQAKMPMIALTAYVMREHRIAIDEAGADGVIPKPILSIEQFGQDILTLMERRRPAAARLRAGPEFEEPVIEEAVYQTLANSIGDSAMKELLQKVETDVLTAQQRITDGVSRDDLAEVIGASHILISVAGAVGAVRLQTLAQCLNAAGHASDKTVVQNETDRLGSEIAQVLAFVRSKREG